MDNDVPLSKLEDDVHQGLKEWRKAGEESISLDYLHLFRQARLETGGNSRQAANQILLQGLEMLERDHPAEAGLLRGRFLDSLTMRVVANRLNVSEVQAYRKQKEAIARLALILQAAETQARETHRQKLESRLEPPTYVRLVGVEQHLDALQALLAPGKLPWLASIEGLGGIGKTSLADALVRRFIQQGLFEDIGWISARSHVFNLGGGIKPVAAPALTAEDLVEKLAAQLMPDLYRTATFSAEEGLNALRARLKQQPHLIVIDNLETVADLETLLPALRSLIEPSKFLLTSRQSLPYEVGLYPFSLPPLSESNALRLLRHEAELHNLTHLKTAGDQALGQIYRVVGGNPLALRLVAGQTRIHTLEVILDDLTAARGQQTEALYTFIYRRVWDLLSEPTRQVFLAMPLVSSHGGSLDYLTEISGLAPGLVRDALEELVGLNLVDSQGSLTERRFTIHNLTRAFLQEQVAKWQ